MSAAAVAFWAREDRRRQAREHDSLTCSECNPPGLATDEVMARLARHWAEVIGPAPADDWSSYEPNTYGGT